MTRSHDFQSLLIIVLYITSCVTHSLPFSPMSFPASTLIETIPRHTSILIRREMEGRWNGLLTAARREYVNEWQGCSSHLRRLCGYQYPCCSILTVLFSTTHTNSLMRLSIKKIIFPSHHICNAEMRNFSPFFCYRITAIVYHALHSHTTVT